MIKHRLESKPLTKLWGVRTYYTSTEYDRIVQQIEATVLEQCSRSAVLTSYALMHTISMQVISFEYCATASDDRKFWDRYPGIADQNSALTAGRLNEQYDNCPTVFQDTMLSQWQKCLYDMTICLSPTSFAHGTILLTMYTPGNMYDCPFAFLKDQWTTIRPFFSDPSCRTEAVTVSSSDLDVSYAAGETVLC